MPNTYEDFSKITTSFEDFTDFSPSKNYAKTLYFYLLKHGAELNYIHGTGIDDLTTGHVFSLSPDVSMGIAVGWNYLDGIYSIILGLHQLFDEEDHHQMQNKAKGLLNIISGIQMFAFSYNPPLTAALGLTGATALAAPAFALSMLCDLITASIDFCNAYKEAEFSGWLDERVKEVNFLQKRIDKIEQQIADEIKKQEEKNETEIQSSLILTLQKKKKQLEARQFALKMTMETRCRVYCHDENNLLKTKEADIIKNTLKNLNMKGNDGGYSSIDYITPPTEHQKLKNEKIQIALNHQYEKSRTYLGIRSLSFVGMTLLAIAPFVSSAAFPPLLITGLAIITIVGSYYFLKNSEKIINTLGEMKKTIQHRFFNSSSREKKLNVSEEPNPALGMF